MCLRTKACCVSKLGILEACLSDAGLKSWGSNVQFEPFVFHREAPSFEFPPNCESPQYGWGLWQEPTPSLLSILKQFSSCFHDVQLSLSRPLGFLERKLFHL